MAERYLPPRVAELVEAAGRRPHSWAEERIRRDGRRFYADSKKARLRELLRDARGDPDTRRKLTNLASAEASRKKKQFVQERSFQALRRLCAAQRSLARAVAVLVAANERQRSDNVRLAALLTNSPRSDHHLTALQSTQHTLSLMPMSLPLPLPPSLSASGDAGEGALVGECAGDSAPFDDLAPLSPHPFLDIE